MTAKRNSMFWKKKWTDQDTPWDLGRQHPILHEGLELLKQKKLLGIKFRAAVPACGTCYDGAALASSYPECHVLGYDIEDLAVRKAQSIHKGVNNLSVSVMDHFTPDTNLESNFDLVLDRAALCAFHPDQQMQFLECSARLLKVGGILVSAPFIEIIKQESAAYKSSGPPYEMSDKVLKFLTDGSFKLIYFKTVLKEASSSVLRKEALVIVQKR